LTNLLEISIRRSHDIALLFKQVAIINIASYSTEVLNEFSFIAVLLFLEITASMTMSNMQAQMPMRLWQERKSEVLLAQK
jgi:hypothetical protein